MAEAKPDPNPIEAKVEALERQARKLRIRANVAGLGILIGLLVSIALITEHAVPEPKTIVAQRLVLCDDGGTERVVLDVSGSEAGLCVYDAEGHLLGTFGATEDGPGMMLYDSQGTFRAQLKSMGRVSGLVLADSLGRARVVLASVKGGPAMAMLDEEGNLRLRLDGRDGGVDPDELRLGISKPSVDLWDHAGKRLAARTSRVREEDTPSAPSSAEK